MSEKLKDKNLKLLDKRFPGILEIIEKRRKRY